MAEFFNARNEKLDYNKAQDRSVAADAILHDIMHAIARDSSAVATSRVLLELEQELAQAVESFVAVLFSSCVAAFVVWSRTQAAALRLVCPASVVVPMALL